MDQSSSSSAGPPPAKRIKKFEVISGSADAATRAASALDLESDDIPEQFKCPICKEVPLGEVIQCPKGHPICKECQLKSGKLECSQCRTAMKSGGGDWIRVRMVEEILDALWFACRFRSNGCKKILSREQVQSHKEGCRFEERVQICKYLSNGSACDYWTRTAKPEEALQHLRNHLNGFSFDRNNDHFWFDVGNPIFNYVEAILTKQNGATYLTIAWSDRRADNISFACVRMDKPTPGQVEATKVELTLEREKPRPRLKIPNWKLVLPVVSVLEAPKTVLNQKPVVVPRLFLKEYLLKDQLKKAERDSDEGEDSDDDDEEVIVRVFVSIS